MNAAPGATVRRPSRTKISIALASSPSFSSDPKRSASVETKADVISETAVWGSIWPVWEDDLAVHRVNGRASGLRKKCNIIAMDVSPDRARMVIGSTDKTARVYEIASGTRVFSRAPSTREGRNSEAIVDVSYSFCGQYVCAATSATVYVINLATFKEWDVNSTNNGRGNIFSAAFSPDKKLLAVGDRGNNISLFDYHSSEPLFNILESSKEAVLTFVDLSFNGNGSWLACAGNVSNTAKTITVVELHGSGGQDRGQERRVYDHDQVVNCVRFSISNPNNNSHDQVWLAVGGHLGVTLRDFNTGSVVMSFPHEGGVTSLSWSPDSKYFAAGDADFIVDEHRPGKNIPCKAWTTVRDTRSGGVVAQYEHDTSVICQNFAGQDGHILVTASGSRITARNIVAVDVTQTFPNQRAILQHSLSFSDDSEIICEGDRKGIILHNVKNRRKINKWKFPSDGNNLNAVDLSPNGKLVAVGTVRNKVILLDATNASRQLEVYTHDASVESVRFSPDSRIIVAGDSSGKVVVRWIEEQRELLLCKLPGRITSLCVSPTCDQLGVTFKHDNLPYSDGEDGASASNPAAVATAKSLVGDNCALIYELEEQENRVSCFEDTDTVEDIEFSKDGRWIATGGVSKMTNIYERASETLTHSFKHESRVLAVSFSGCSTMLAAGGFDKSVTVYSVTSGEVMSTYKGTDTIWTVAWSPNSKFIAAGTKGDSSVVMHLSPLISSPQTIRSNWIGLMRRRPYLWRLPRPSDADPKIISTPLNDISPRILKPLLDSGACSLKFANLSRRFVNPKCPETETLVKQPDNGVGRKSEEEEGGESDAKKWLSPLDRALLVDDDHHKCKLLTSLVDVACNDGDSSFSHWIATLAGRNNLLLTETLKVCVVPTKDVAHSERIIMPAERVILPSDNLNPRWQERRHPSDRSKTREKLKKEEEERREKSTRRSTIHQTDGACGFLFSREFLDSRFTKNTRNMKERGVETIAIGPPHFIREAFSKIVKEGSIPVFETEVMQYTVDYLWLKLRWFYLLQVTLYLLLLGFFTLGHIFNLDTIAAVDPLSPDPSLATGRLLARLAYYISVVLGLFFLVQEMRQMCRSGLFDYFEGGWNVLEFGSYVLTLASVIWTELSLPWQNIVGAVAMMWIWTGMLSHLRGISAFGGIIATFVQILVDTGGFMGIMALFWFGGAMSFKVLLPGSGDFANFNALLSVWYMILGDPIPDSFVVEGTPSGINGTKMDYGIHGIETARHALWTQITAQVLSTGFVFVIMIVLLNQLIALMGDSYAKVMDDYVVQTRRSRAKVIVSLIELYGFCVRDHKRVLQPRWLHVLRPVNRGSGSGEGGGNWEGNLKAIKRDIASSRNEMNVKLTQTEEELADKIDRISSNFRSSTAEILVKLQALSRRRVAPG